MNETENPFQEIVPTREQVIISVNVFFHFPLKSDIGRLV